MDDRLAEMIERGAVCEECHEEILDYPPGHPRKCVKCGGEIQQGAGEHWEGED